MGAFDPNSFSTDAFSPDAFDFGDAVSPVETPVRCRAYRVGFFGERLYRTGDVFAITQPQQYSPYWMALVDALPESWSVESLVLEIDIQRLRWLEAAEVAALIRDPNGPYRRRRA